jgi:RNA polymerase sigma-70 factor, ECF subfamily
MRYRPCHGQPGQKPDFGEYLDGLYGYALVLSHNRTEAEDLVQETCLRALGAIDRLRTQSNVKGWLFTILRNAWRNQMRRSRPETIGLADQYDGGDPADPAQDPHAAFASRVEQEQMRAAIRQLPVEYSEIITLREYEELSYQEIAAVLSCPPGTAMSRLARARAKLRALLAGDLITPRANGTLQIGPRHKHGIGFAAESSSPEVE